MNEVYTHLPYLIFTFIGLMALIMLWEAYREGRRAHGKLWLTLKNPVPKGGLMLETVITNEQKIQAVLSPNSAADKPAPIDGKPEWSVNPTEGGCTLEVAEDGLSAFIISSDSPSESLVTIKADADLGSGVQTIMDSIKVTVEGARATSLGLSLGTPVPK